VHEPKNKDNDALLSRRYYEPSIGRFVSNDPIGLAGGANSYAYARNNPVSRVPLDESEGVVKRHYTGIGA
jgi:RHS repeat-associated protein